MVRINEFIFYYYMYCFFGLDLLRSKSTTELLVEIFCNAFNWLKKNFIIQRAVDNKSPKRGGSFIRSFTQATLSSEQLGREREKEKKTD